MSTVRRLCVAATRWATTILALITAAVWAGTLRYQLTFVDGVGRYEVLVYGGAVCYGTDYASIGPVRKFFFERANKSNRWVWKPHWKSYNFGQNPAFPVRLVDVPLWLPFLVTGIPAALLWSRHMLVRRRCSGLCASCGYDRRGLVANAACPECGTPAPPPRRVAGPN